MKWLGVMMAAMLHSAGLVVMMGVIAVGALVIVAAAFTMRRPSWGRVLARAGLRPLELRELQRPLFDGLRLTQQHGSHGDLRRWLPESYPCRHDYVRMSLRPKTTHAASSRTPVVTP